MNISTATAFLEDMFNALNERFFDGELPPVMITIQTSKRAYGHFTPWKSWAGDGEGKNEINISAEYLNRDVGSLVATLLHEMIHYYCYLHGIQDTSRGGTYHNKRFKAEAEKRGLTVYYDTRIGYSITKPGILIEDFVKDYKLDGVNIHRLIYNGVQGDPGGSGVISTGGDDEAPKKSNVRKYICPCCHKSVRATRDVNIACLDCNTAMELAS